MVDLNSSDAIILLVFGAMAVAALLLEIYLHGDKKKKK